MNFEFTPEEQKLRKTFVAFIDQILPDWWRENHKHDVDDKAFELTLQVCEAMAEKGWLIAHWPKEYGGRESSVWEELVMREELWSRYEPRGPQYASVNWIGPSLMAFGTQEQKDKHLGDIARGRSLWCQAFSEPQAGSDLGGVRTTAIRDGDEYVINGEKTWISRYSRAEYAFLVARTDPNSAKHRGISVFLVPMDTPGIHIRPLDSIKGYVFASIVFEDVRVPASSLLGEENDGWRTTLAALKFERIGTPRYIESLQWLSELIRYCKKTRRNGKLLIEHDWVRRKLADLRADCEVAKLLFYRAISQVARGETGTMESSLGRIATASCMAKTFDVAYEIVGPEAQRKESATGFTAALGRSWPDSVTPTIATGSFEIQNTVVATRGLGLPRS